MPERNVATEAILQVLSTFHTMHKERGKKVIPPLMMESTSREGMARRFSKMTPQERTEMLQRNGLEATMNMLGQK